jgi:CRP/FNR family transcriptional regulator, nitrogen oxide reductase regulator
LTEAVGLSAGGRQVPNLESRLLDGMSDCAVEELFAAALPRRVRANSIVASQDDPADYLFLLREGSARHFVFTHEGRKLLLRWLSPGDIIGAGVFLPYPSTYVVSTEMVEASSVLVWNRTTIRGLAKQHPRLLENACAVASDYLVWFVASHSALISRTARQRVAGVLASLACGLGRKVRGGIEINLTNEELANSSNVTPFTASRFLSEWQRKGVLLKSRGKILLHDAKCLLVQAS